MEKPNHINYIYVHSVLVYILNANNSTVTLIYSESALRDNFTIVEPFQASGGENLRSEFRLCLGMMSLLVDGLLIIGFGGVLLTFGAILPIANHPHSRQ